MRVDFKVALILAISAVPAGATLMVAPEYLHLSGVAVPLTFWGGIVLAMVLILTAAIIALRAEREAAPGQWRLKRMWPQYRMVVGGTLFLIGLVAFLQLNVRAPETKRITEAQDAESMALVTKKGLEQYFLESDGYWRRLLMMPKNISGDDYKKLQDEIDNWSLRFDKYVNDRLGPMAHARMAQFPENPQMFHAEVGYPVQIAQDRSNTLTALNIQRNKILKLIDDQDQIVRGH